MKLFFNTFFGLTILLFGCSKKPLEVNVLSSGFIYENALFPQCHASTIVETDEGLLSAWFGGTHEKHPDVCIYTSTFTNDQWSTPKKVADGVINDTLRYPCWNPVLFKEPSGLLTLYYKVGPNAQEWWGMLKTSADDGKTWSEATRLQDGFLGPIKNKPVLTSAGRLICPSSYEDPKTDEWRVHFEISDDMGKSWKKVSIKDDDFDIIQPSVLFHPDDRLQILARSKENYVVTSWSSDNGDSWSAPELTTLPNPNSGTDAVTLADGTQLIVYNPTKRREGKWGGPRTPLSIAISKDGIAWKNIYTLEDQPGEYSYPAVIQASDGSIHVTYTYKREMVKHVAFRLE